MYKKYWKKQTGRDRGLKKNCDIGEALKHTPRKPLTIPYRGDQGFKIVNTNYHKIPDGIMNYNKSSAQITTM
jgi:hypothetical protein